MWKVLFLLPFLVLPLLAERKLLNHTKTEYPTVALQTGTSGIVALKVLVLANGLVKNTMVISGPPLLVEPCQKEVMRWKFEVGKDEDLLVVFIFNFAEDGEEERSFFQPRTLVTSVVRIRPNLQK